MSEKQAKRRRQNQRLEYIAEYNRWVNAEPPIWHFRKWRKWKQARPALGEKRYDP